MEETIFENRWKKILFGKVGHGNGITGDIRPGVKALIDEMVARENKEWREGRRCEICGGEAKGPNLTTMCDDCLETQ